MSSLEARHAALIKAGLSYLHAVERDKRGSERRTSAERDFRKALSLELEAAIPELLLSTLRPAEVVNVCPCRAIHTTSTWPSLRFVGIQKDDEGDLELRSCRCGSTRAVPLTKLRPVTSSGPDSQSNPSSRVEARPAGKDQNPGPRAEAHPELRGADAGAPRRACCTYHQQGGENGE